MITRRFTATGLAATGLTATGVTTIGFPAAARAPGPLSEKERRALTRLAQLAPVESARFGAMPPLYRRCAATYRLSNKSLAVSLETIARALVRTASELAAGGRALPRFPTPADRLSPALRDMERDARSAWGPVTGPVIERTEPPPTTDPLPSWGAMADLRTSARTWRDLAGGLRVLGRDSRADLAPAASRFEQASTQLDAAAQILGGVLAERDLESDDRLDGFDIQELMRSLNQSQTAASATQRALSSVRMDTIRNVG